MREFNAKQAQDINELIKFNNEYVGLMKQKNQYEMAIKNVQNEMKNVSAGRGFPLIKAIGKNIFKTVPKAERKDILSEMKMQKNMLENSLKGIEGQLLHKSDEYEGAALKVYRHLHATFKDVDLGPATSWEMPSVKEGEPSA